MKPNSLSHYGSIGLLAFAAAICGHAVRNTYSVNQIDKDAEQLSVPLNGTHHIEIYPDVYKSTTGQTHNFSRVRIAANDPTSTSYSYDITKRRIEGYELAPDQLPDFLKDKQSLSIAHQKACAALANYTPTYPSLINDYATAKIQARVKSVEYLQHNFCS